MNSDETTLPHAVASDSSASREAHGGFVPPPQVGAGVDEVIAYYDHITRDAPADDIEWDFVMTAAEYRVLRTAALNADKFKWQVRDTCVRAEKAEAQGRRDATNDSGRKP